jgi:hypothetical protein
MALTWETLYARAKRRYGLEVGGEDNLLVDRLFLDRVNEVLRELAAPSGAFREEFSLALTAASLHALDTRIISVIEHTVRIDYDGSGDFLTELDFADEQTLRRQYGALENEPAGQPEYWYPLRGATTDATLRLALFPPSDRAVSPGIRFSARVVPAELTLPASTLPVQAGEEGLLIPGICMCLAEVELSRGSQGAGGKLEMWERRWNEAKTAFADRVEDGLRAGRRRIHYLPDDEDY